jgi:hypothetical protein
MVGPDGAGRQLGSQLLCPLLRGREGKNFRGYSKPDVSEDAWCKLPETASGIWTVKGPFRFTC